MENKKTSMPQGWSMEGELKVFLDRIRAVQNCKHRQGKPVKPKGKAHAWFIRLLTTDFSNQTTVTIRYR